MNDYDDLVLFLTGGIWRTSCIGEQPVINLIRWRVIAVRMGEGAVTRHYVGFNADDAEGRVSSAIIRFSPETARGVTKSGRVYQLVGPSGYDGDADYVWRRWAAVNTVSEEHDVSSEIEQMIAEAAPPVDLTPVMLSTGRERPASQPAGSAARAGNRGRPGASTRTALAKMVTIIFRHWNLTSSEKVALLGLSNPQRYVLNEIENGAPLPEDKEILARTHFVLHIYKNLRLLFPNDRDLAYRWVKQPNQALGHTPLELMTMGFDGLASIYHYLTVL